MTKGLMARLAPLTGAAWLVFAALGYAADPMTTGLMNPHFGNIADELENARAEKKILMIYFWQEGCPYCLKMETETFANDKVRQAIMKNAWPIEINIFGAKEITDLAGKSMTEKTFAASLGVRYTPTIVYFDEDGKEAFRLPGYWEPPHAEASVAYVKGKEYKKRSFQEFLRYDWFLRHTEDIKPKEGGKE